jgi:hypothetical protein
MNCPLCSPLEVSDQSQVQSGFKVAENDAQKDPLRLGVNPQTEVDRIAIGAARQKFWTIGHKSEDLFLGLLWKQSMFC